MIKVRNGGLFILPFIATVWSSCNVDQKNHCLDLYRKSASFWSKDTEMSDCASKPYSEFTHICSVPNYLPNIDHCCCISKDQEPDSYDESAEDSGGRYRRQANGSSIFLAGLTRTRHKRNSDPVVMCCRYHQDWNKFRCQESLDTLDTRFAQGSVFQSNFESLTSSLLCYGFFVLIAASFVAVIVCYVRRRRSRKCKDNNTAASRAHGIIAPPFGPFDEVPPPYTQDGYCSPSYNRHSSLHHPLIPVDSSRIEPSAPVEEENLLHSSVMEYFFTEGRDMEDRLNSTTTVMTTLESSEDHSETTAIGSAPQGFSNSARGTGNCRETENSFHRQAEEASSPDSQDVFPGPRLSPPPSYEESIGRV